MQSRRTDNAGIVQEALAQPFSGAAVQEVLARDSPRIAVDIGHPLADWIC
jgi:hypothetical protein